MLNVMKYELLRRKKLLITTLVVFAFLEAGICVGMMLGNSWGIMSIVFAVLLLAGSFAFPFLDAAINYFSDFKKKNGYMLFLTPNSGYKVLGAKMLFTLMEFAVIVFLVVVSVKVDYSLLNSLYLEEVSSEAGNVMAVLAAAMGVETLTFMSFLPLIISAVLQYFANVTVVLTSITIAKTVLSNKDFNWLLALLFYIALYTVVQLINSGALAVSGFIGDVFKLAAQEQEDLPNIRKYIAVIISMYTLLIAGGFFLSGRLLNKRTDL